MSTDLIQLGPINSLLCSKIQFLYDAESTVRSSLALLFLLDPLAVPQLTKPLCRGKKKKKRARARGGEEEKGEITATSCSRPALCPQRARGTVTLEIYPWHQAGGSSLPPALLPRMSRTPSQNVQNSRTPSLPASPSPPHTLLAGSYPRASQDKATAGRKHGRAEPSPQPAGSPALSGAGRDGPPPPTCTPCTM